MQKSEIGNIKAENTEKIIKSYREGITGEYNITRYDQWLHFSFCYEDIIDFTILVCSSRIDDVKAIEKAIVGFCDTIIKKHPGKIFDKQKIEIICKNPPEWIPEDPLSDGLIHRRGLTNFFDLNHNDYKIELITYQIGDEIIGTDVLKEAFTKFAEIYAEEKHFTTP